MAARPRSQQKVEAEASVGLPVSVTLKDIQSVLLLLASADDEVVDQSCKSIATFIADEDSTPEAQVKELLAAGVVKAILDKVVLKVEEKEEENTNEETGEVTKTTRNVYTMEGSQLSSALVLESLLVMVEKDEEGVIGDFVQQDGSIDLLTLALRWAMQEKCQYPDPRPGAIPPEAAEDIEVTEGGRILNVVLKLCEKVCANAEYHTAVSSSDLFSALFAWAAQLDSPIVTAEDGEGQEETKVEEKEKDEDEEEVVSTKPTFEAETTQGRSWTCISHLTASFEFLRKVLPADLLPTIIKCLKAFNAYVVERAVVVVDRLAKLAVERAHLVKYGAVEPVGALLAETVSVALPRDDKAEKKEKKKKPSSKGKGAPPPAEVEEVATASVTLHCSNEARRASASALASFACEARGRRELMRTNFGVSMLSALDTVLAAIEKEKEKAGEDAAKPAEGEKKKGKKKGRASASAGKSSSLPTVLEELLFASVQLAGRSSSDDRGADYILSLTPQRAVVESLRYCLSSSSRRLRHTAAEVAGLIFRAVSRDPSLQVERRLVSSGLLEPLCRLLSLPQQVFVHIPDAKPEGYAGSDEEWEKSVEDWNATRQRVTDSLDSASAGMVVALSSLGTFADSTAVREELKGVHVPLVASAAEEDEEKGDVLELAYRILQTTLPPYTSADVLAEQEPALANGGVTQSPLTHSREDFHLCGVALTFVECFLRDPSLREQELRFVHVAAECFKLLVKVEGELEGFGRSACNAACRVLTLFSHDVKGREEILTAGVVPAAIAFLTKPVSESITVGVLQFLRVAMKERPLAEVAVDNDALPLLQHIASAKAGEGAGELSSSIIDQIIEVDLSARLWWSGSIPEGLPLYSGFYDCGRAKARGDPWLKRDEHKSVQLGTKWKETVVVNIDADEGLQSMLEKVEARIKEEGAVTENAVLKIVAEEVSGALGGEMEMEGYAHFSYIQDIDRIRVGLGANYVPIGDVKRGNARHRAVLFKVLLDLLRSRTSTPAANVGEEGSEEVSGEGEGESVAVPPSFPHVSLDRCEITRGALALFSWNEYVGEDGTRKVVDLLDAVGSVYEVESDEGRRYCRKGENAFSYL